ncbi:hypothetical protein THRCLA_04808 [Thraustotheca clavata]|uniref:Anoctamin dimerisation domain-containing protein n=1 Tax=Thraustotheca clavata TaxID=74557 RepID=A0A1V9ZYI8_9STRA|nr:hypothetical protein THRCLA_04808 [Thraustotheca clavata]
MDPFEQKNGFNYDYALVFKLGDGEDEKDKKEPSEFQKKYNQRFILARLANAGLETKLFHATIKDIVICKIRASYERLCKEADRIDMKLELDPVELQAMAQAGDKAKGIAEIHISAEHTHTHRNAFENIFGKYDMEERLQRVYKKYGPEGKKIPFRGVDRIKLILSIIQAHIHDGGCALNLQMLEVNNCLVTAFALHDFEERDRLNEKWINWSSPPWKQPYNDIKDYYGEKIGLYFVWLGHYTTWLIAPSIVGALMLADIAIEATVDARFLAFFGVFMAMWGTFYLEYWKRRNAVVRLEWGMDGFEEEEHDRAEFEGEFIDSPVDGSKVRYFSPEVRTKRVLSSLLIIFALVLLVIGVVAAIFVFRNLAEEEGPLHKYTTIRYGENKTFPLGSPIASTLNAIQIQVMNGLYMSIAVKLNNYENHRTDTEYEDNLIAKAFLFQFVNSYASLFYIAFIKYYANKCSPDAEGGCIYDLMIALGIIFVLRLTSGNFFEAVLPYIKRRVKAKFSKPATAEDDNRVMSSAEAQMALGVYDDMGIFGDYNEMIIQYGYITLFVISFPLAPFLALVNNYFEIRIDAFKLAKESRRPNPKGAEDIGTWMTILEIMSTIAVITNVAAAIFTSHTTFSGVSGEWKLIAFIVIEHGILLMKYFLAIVVEDVPEDVQLQLDRAKFLVSKIILQVRDDDDDDLIKGNKLKNEFKIYPNDEDDIVPGDDIEDISFRNMKPDASMPLSPHHVKLQLQNQEPFELKYGYNHDYVFVFKVHDENAQLTEVQTKYSMRFILQRLASAGLETKLFYSSTRDLVFCKIRASLERLSKEADRIDLKLEFDPVALKELAARGNRERGIAPIMIREESHQTKRSPFKHIFGKFDMEDRLAEVYKKYGPKQIPFRGVDRIKLILSIIHASVSDGGCELNTKKLELNECIVTCYALHNFEERNILNTKWINWSSAPSNQPFNDIKDYYGEKIGLYFVWLGHYTTWLIAPSIFGALMLGDIAIEGTVDAKFLALFGLFMALWGTFYLEYWKRRNAVVRLEWGTDGFEDEENDRAEFYGMEEPSPIDGKVIKYFSPTQRTSRVLKSLLIIFGLILLVIGAVAAIFVFRFVSSKGHPLYNFTTIYYNNKEIPLASPLASTLNAIQIQVMNGVYMTIAVKLNNYENHRTDTQYEDNLIAKAFLFQFVNSYASLFYIAFIKYYVNDCSPDELGGCIYDLMVALGIIFGLRLTSGNFFEAILPYIKRRLKAKCSSPPKHNGEERIVSSVEAQMALGVYDDMSVFGDYNEMIIQFGYITLFVISFPLAPFLALLNNYFEIRIDAFKLAWESRRPNPKGAEDIGTWMTILEIMGAISVMTNVAAAVFTSHTTFSGVSNETKLAAFIALEHGILMIKYMFSILVDDVPHDVAVQFERQKFLVDKIVHLIQDDEDDDLVKGNKIKIDLTVYDEDDE